MFEAWRCSTKMTAWDIGALNVELWLCCQLYCNRGDKKTEGSLKLLRSLGRGGAVVWGDLLFYLKKTWMGFSSAFVCLVLLLLGILQLSMRKKGLS